MKESPKSAPGGAKKFARRLLTSTCLTAAAAGVAHAGLINETSFGDFGNTFGAATSLPVGATQVFGSINPSGDNDFFTFTGLVGGGSYTLAGSYENSQRVGVLNSAGGTLNGLLDIPASMTGTVPGDGVLVVQVAQNEQVAFYDLTLTAASVPEPSTLAGVGLGLAGALALRRKLAKK